MVRYLIRTVIKDGEKMNKKWLWGAIAAILTPIVIILYFTLK